MARIHEVIVETSRDIGGLVASKKAGAGISFAYRGIDDVVTHIKGALDKEGVLYWPSAILSKDIDVREIAGGKAITTTSLVVEYTFHATEDNSEIIVTVPGFAQDFADRNDAQAMSVALRTALIQIFRLQGGDKDPEVTGEDANREIEKAATTAKPATATVKKRTAATVRDEIADIIANPAKPYDGEAINALGRKHSKGKEPSEWMGDLTVLEAIAKSVEAGELA